MPESLTNPYAPSSSPTLGPRRSARRVLIAMSLLLGAVVLVVYWGGLRGEFLGPDHALFNRSPLVSPPTASGASGPILPAWLPRTVTVLSLELDRLAWNSLPAGFRTTNVILHWLTSLFVFLVGLRWMRRVTPAAAAAILFAVHPIHTTTVDVAGARGEILAALFGLLALLCLSLSRSTDDRIEGAVDGPRQAGRIEPGDSGRLADLAPEGRSRAPSSVVPASRGFWLLAAAGACLLATFSSPIALTLPLLVVLADLVAPGRTSSASTRVKDWIIVAAACLPSALASLVLAPPVAPLNRWLTGRALLDSLRLLVVPYPLKVYRIIGPGSGADALSVVALVLAVGIVVGAILLMRSRELPFSRRALILGVVPVVALALLPPAAPGSDVPFPLLEEHLYLASAGACLVLAGLFEWVGWALFAAGARTSSRVWGGWIISAAVSLVFAALTVTRHPVLKNDVAFYAAAAVESPSSSIVRVRLADAAGVRGQADKGIEVLKPLLEQRPSDPDLHLLLANLHRDSRDLESAEREAREALKLRPSFAEAHATLGLIERERGNIEGAEKAYREAIRLAPNLAEAHNNLGSLLASRGADLEALEELKKALELDPTLGDAAANLGSFLIEQKRPDEAIDIVKQGLQHSAANARLHYVLGVALQSQGKRAEAENAYERAIQLDPGYARPLNNLAILLTEEKKLDEAVTLLKRLTELEPANERAHYNLGIAYRAKGDRGKAAAEFATALRLQPDYADASRALSDMLNAPRTPATQR